jgi:hypothetical protein
MAQHILNVCIRWIRTVSFTSRPLYLWKSNLGTHWIVWVDPTTGLDAVEKRSKLHPLRIQLRNFGRPACSAVTTLTELS